MTRAWQAEGTRYERIWGGRTWTLTVDAERPGLVAQDGRIGPLLAVEGVSAGGRPDSGPIGPSLIGHETHLGRLEATYAPRGWSSLRVRASWIPRGEHVLDLEVQIQASSVDELGSVEVHISSHPGGHDGSTPQLARHDVTHTAFLAETGGAAPAYLEMIHPDDGTRRDLDRAERGVRYALFGHDLERGVVLRGRLRGIWLPSRPDEPEIGRQLDAFLREPLPLGT